MHPAAAAWQEALTRLDRWFAAAEARHPGVIPCRAGCSACCHGPFDISAADTLLLREGLSTLDPAVRTHVRERGERLLARMRTLAPQWGPPWDVSALGDEGFDRLADSLATEPCPLLDDAGQCRVYAHRPLVCRLIGLPMLTAGGDVLENACPIQEQFPGYQDLDPLAFDLEALEDLELAALEASALALWGAPPDLTRETTIAAVAAGQEG